MDAQTESVNEPEDLDAAIMAELQAQEAPEEPVEEADESPAPEEAEASEAPVEAAEPEQEAEEKLDPLHHWPSQTKEFFSALDRKGQEYVMEREKNFDRAYTQATQELSQAKGFVTEMQEIIGPMVQDWERQGLSPSAGIRQAVATMKALKENPQEFLMQVAQERGVDLQSAWAEQPYQDPQLVAAKREIAEMKEQLQQFSQSQENAQREQSEAAQRQAFQQVVEMRDAKDESGNPKYPYMETLLPNMTAALESGRVNSLEAAYSTALEELRGHPAIRDLVSTQTQSVATARKAEAEKAKAASKAVDSNSTGSSAQPKSLDDDIMEALEAQGLQ